MATKTTKTIEVPAFSKIVMEWIEQYKFETWKDVRHLPDSSPMKGLVIKALYEGYQQGLMEK